MRGANQLAAIKKAARMKVALISTTINAPRVFALYRAFGPDVDIIVAGDRRTPHAEARALLAPLGARYLDCSDQDALGWASSEAIGWNCIQRRNIALLEAIRARPDVITTVDDDNIPLDANYFADVARILGQPFCGLAAGSETGWFDIGAFITPVAPHRGLPPEHRRGAGPVLEGVVGARIGVAAGLWLGDPDTDAMTRIVARPNVLHISDAARAGIVVRAGCLTPFNSQNTAYIAELAPLMAMWVGVGRYDDIWASLFAQRVMLETGHLVHFGRPFVWQQRNAQDLLTNAEGELHGDRHTTHFARDLLDAKLSGKSIPDLMRQLFVQILDKTYVPDAMRRFAPAWCADIERIAA